MAQTAQKPESQQTDDCGGAPATHGSFCWNELLTHDPERSMTFYADTIGWTFDPMKMQDGGTYWVAKAGDKMVGGIFEMKGPDFADVPEGWMPYLAVDDVDARAKKATAAGATLMRPLFDIPGIGRWRRSSSMSCLKAIGNTSRNGMASAALPSRPAARSISRRSQASRSPAISRRWSRRSSALTARSFVLDGELAIVKRWRVLLRCAASAHPSGGKPHQAAGGRDAGDLHPVRSAARCVRQEPDRGAADDAARGARRHSSPRRSRSAR